MATEQNAALRGQSRSATLLIGRSSGARLLTIALLGFATACASPTSEEQDSVELLGSVESPVASDDLSVELAARVREVAESDTETIELLGDGRTVFSGVERVRVKTDAGEDGRRELVRVIHYRYDDDAAIHTLVELDDLSVVERRATRHLPVGLATDELEEARKLALADKRVTEWLGDARDDVVIEALVLRTSDKSDPIFGRRVVTLIFRDGRDYVGGRSVTVDLTGGTVDVERRER